MVHQILSWEEQCKMLCEKMVAAKKKGETFVLRRTRVRAVKPIDAEKRVIRYIASDETVDRYGDIIRVKGWELGNFKENPQFLWSHDYIDGLPLGLVTMVKKDRSVKKDPKLITDVQYHTEDLNPFAESVYKLVLVGGLRMVSVGFDPIDYNIPDNKEEREELGLGVWGVEYLRQDLLELSQVKVPGNPKAGQINEDFEASIAKAVGEKAWDSRHALVFVERSGDHWADLAQPILRSLNVIKGPKLVFEMEGKGFSEEDVQAVLKFEQKRRETIDRAKAEEKRLADLEASSEEERAVERPGWDETEDYFRYRVRNPDLFIDNTIKTVTIKKDKPRVKSVMGKLKKDGEDGPMTIQNLMFPKEDGWTLDEAKAWLKDHPDLKKGLTWAELKALFPEAEYDDEPAALIMLEKDKSLVIALPTFDKAGTLSISWHPQDELIEPATIEGFDITAHLEEVRRIVRDTVKDEIRKAVKTDPPGSDAGEGEGASQTPPPGGDDSEPGKKGAVELCLSKAKDLQKKIGN